MPWQLEIHIIDVGQGESSLIIATDPPMQRTMLIDAGEPTYAQTVHNYIVAQGLQGVDHILVSHYDGDHSGGVIALLIADNLYRVCDVIAQAAAAQAVGGANRLEQIARGAAAACAVMMGAYNNPNGANHSGHVAAVIARIGAVAAGNDRGAADQGIQTAINYMQAQAANYVNPTLVRALRRRNVARMAGYAAANTIAPGVGLPVVLNNTRTAVFNVMRTGVSVQSRFLTNGLYANAHLIDIGNTVHIPADYQHAIGGRFLMSGYLVQAPGINRLPIRTSNPPLANEILWNSGPVAVAAPANSPAIFVMARNKYIWNAPAHLVPIASGQPDNDDSIGLILRFNNFFYYTGGDLPAQGEELVATAVRNNGLPNPAGGAVFPPPHRIACFKCGHHGADTATSQNFLTTAQPRGAFISSGNNPAFGHPTQNVVTRLHNYANVRFFYITNCNFATVHVPASNGLPQLVAGNKSRVAGDNNNVNNLAVGRQRGDIRLSINQAESTAGAGVPGQQYHVQYFEEDDNPAALPAHVPVGLRTENTNF